MFDSAAFIHYGVIACTIVMNSISVGIGQGLSSLNALNAINRQPAARNDIIRVALIGMTLIETVAILALLMAILLLFKPVPSASSFFESYSEIGIAFAICVTGFVIGITSSIPASAASHAIARQPLLSQKIFILMLMTQVLIQTPVISGLIISFFIQSQSVSALFMSDSLRLIASGLCIGLGSIGPAIGLSLFSKAAISGIGRNPSAYNKILSFTFISEAIIETPIIFCLIVSVILLFVVPNSASDNLLDGIICLSAALCTGLGTLGVGISSGTTASAACAQIADNPESHSIVSRSSMLAQGIIETIVIYAVLLSFVMLLLK